MQKYKIWFGKDPEEMDHIWSDVVNWDSITRFKEEEVAGIFATDSEDMFWQMYINIIDNPPSMWYWLLINDEQVISGAIDPDDPYGIIQEYGAPEWVKEHFDGTFTNI